MLVVCIDGGGRTVPCPWCSRTPGGSGFCLAAKHLPYQQQHINEAAVLFVQMVIITFTIQCITKTTSQSGARTQFLERLLPRYAHNFHLDFFFSPHILSKYFLQKDIKPQPAAVCVSVCVSAVVQPESLKSAEAFKLKEAHSLMWSINRIHTGLQPLHLSCETIRVV